MDLPNPGIEPRSLALQVDTLPTELSGSPLGWLLGLPCQCGDSKLRSLDQVLGIVSIICLYLYYLQWWNACKICSYSHFKCETPWRWAATFSIVQASPLTVTGSFPSSQTDTLYLRWKHLVLFSSSLRKNQTMLLFVSVNCAYSGCFTSVDSRNTCPFVSDFL